MAEEVLHECLISVGSNIEPWTHIEQAHEILSRECRLIAASSIIETAPVGFQDQPNFLNAAFWVETRLDRHAFKNYLRQVEDRLGRERGKIKSGPRTIDLDIVLWNRQVVDDDYYLYDYVRRPADELLTTLGLSIDEAT